MTLQPLVINQEASEHQHLMITVSQRPQSQSQMTALTTSVKLLTANHLLFNVQLKLFPHTYFTTRKYESVLINSESASFE